MEFIDWFANGVTVNVIEAIAKKIREEIGQDG
jgi:hypothetical protein